VDDGDSKEWTDEESTSEGEEQDEYQKRLETLASYAQVKPLWMAFATMAEQVVTARLEAYGPYALTPLTPRSVVKNSRGQSHAEESTSTSAATGSANEATTDSPPAPVSTQGSSASDEGHADWVDTESEGDADDGEPFTHFTQGEVWRQIATTMEFQLGEESGEKAASAFQGVLNEIGISDAPQINNLLSGILAILNTEGPPAQPPETNEDYQDETNEGESHEVGMRGGSAWTTVSLESESDDEQWLMYPEILRVNKQIYDEASSLLYTEGTVVIDAYDMFCLNKERPPERVRFGAIDDHVAWRHNPLEDPGTVAEDGTVTYSTPDFGGLMEPHVFARFQKVLFDATFDELHMRDLEFWLDLDTGKLADSDVSDFQRRLRRSPIIIDLVKVLSLSPFIKKLTINLLLEVRSASRLDEEDTDSEDDESAEREEGKLSLEERIEAADLLANQRATEALMDAKIWWPLKQLCNVKSFDFRNGFSDYDPPVEYQPPQRHVEMVQGLKKAVEANFGKQPVKREKRIPRKRVGVVKK
jgi:hypothetical protein